LVYGTNSIDAAWGCGIRGHFYYQNNALFGIDVDTPDNIMDEADALADISSYLNNNDTGYDLRLEYNGSNNGRF
jgi:hypothetical protein